MTVKEIIENYLVCHGFTGLVAERRECACEITDLAPCDNEFPGDCEPGYKVSCTEDCDHEPGYEPGNWHVQIEKPKEGEGA